MFAGRSEVSPQDRQQIIIDASLIKDSIYWELLTKDMRFHACDMMYNQSKTVEDMVFGKAVLWCIDVMEKKLNNISNVK
jgi:hypothetical protein